MEEADEAYANATLYNLMINDWLYSYGASTAPFFMISEDYLPSLALFFMPVNILGKNTGGAGISLDVPSGPEEGKFEWSGHTCMREIFAHS